MKNHLYKIIGKQIFVLIFHIIKVKMSYFPNILWIYDSKYFIYSNIKITS